LFPEECSNKSDRLIMRILILAVCYMLAIHINNLQAQSYSSVHYDTKDGLPSTTVYDISQDKNGFIWFATENGLCRFDGKNFKTFTTKDGLPDNSVLKVHGDNSGRVYFTPFTHSLYYYEKDNFYKVPIPDKYKVDLSTITWFLNKRDKVILNGIADSYILENNRLISFSDKYKKKPEDILIVRVYDTLIITRSADSFFIISNSEKIRSYLSYDKEKVGEVFDENAQKQQLNIGKRSAFTVREYFRDNLLYEYSDNFANIFSTTTRSLMHKIKVDKLSDAFIDNENNLWISTLGDGVYRFPSFEFRNMSFDRKNEIFSLIKMDHQLIAGTDFSKMYSIPVNNILPDYSIADLSKFITASGNPVTHLTNRNRIYVLRSEGTNLYIGTDAFLLKKTGSSAPVFRKIHPVKDIDVADKEILVCTGYGVLLLDKEDMSIKDTLLKQRATCGIAYQGDYYIGTLGGLIKINSATKVITELYSSFLPFTGRIIALKRGINNDIWIATSGSGLVRFKDGKIIQILKEEDGLTSDICTSLYIDSSLIWLGTNKGLNRIETGKEKLAITRFTSADGLGADFINAVLATDSNIYVGSAAGLTIFNKSILTEKSVCIFHILQVSENNKRLKEDSSFSFPHNALNIQIDFTAISFKSAGDITYYYKLEGLDEKWNTTTANFVNFPVLQPRNYTLFLKAINKFGVESDTKTIRIHIQPPWWQTWFFRLTVLTILGLLVLRIYRYNIRAIKRKEETKREIEARFSALEQKALQAQMNPHFIFNSLNSIQTFILNLDVEGANNYLTNFASLIRQTLENSMHPLISVASEVKYLETYLGLEKLRFRDKFRYEILTDETIDQKNTVLPGMLLQPYIENSLRHGIQHRKDNNGLISLTISKTGDNRILYTITDNGVGRKKAEELKSVRHIEYQSRGTSINEKRIAAINNHSKTNIRVNTEDILDEKGIVTGTTVTVLIPRLYK
jgi:ligand-binding sensor domain-containing protein/two-component sensor histidine kinase